MCYFQALRAGQVNVRKHTNTQEHKQKSVLRRREPWFGSRRVHIE